MHAYMIFFVRKYIIWSTFHRYTSSLTFTITVAIFWNKDTCFGKTKYCTFCVLWKYNFSVKISNIAIVTFYEELKLRYNYCDYYFQSSQQSLHTSIFVTINHCDIFIFLPMKLRLYIVFHQRNNVLSVDDIIYVWVSGE